MEPEELERLFTPEELECFKTNVREHRVYNDFVQYLRVIAKGDVNELVSGAFTWSETPEGHDYWSRISSELPERIESATANPDDLKEERYNLKGYEYMKYFKATEWTRLGKKSLAVHGFEKYTSLMEDDYPTLGKFIVTMLGLETWRGVPNSYKDVIARKKSNDKNVVDGEFYDPRKLKFAEAS